MTSTTAVNLQTPTLLPKDVVFILERSNTPLGVTQTETGDIIMDGTCAVFGQKNDNNRVYEEAEYLPHLTYLVEKIKKGQLFGELDHPQSFDVSLKNVSHVILGLEHDKATNSVKIKVKLLDTPSGRIAKTLVLAGCVISISSRAAGQVLDNGKVKLHKIFTYDLVAEPGFAQAALSQVAENLQGNYTMLFESLDFLKAHSITNNLMDVSESFNFEDSVRVYKINNPETKTPQNNEKQMANDLVTREEMNQYSKVVKKQIEALRESINNNNAGLLALSEKTDDLPVTEKLVKFTNYLAGEMEKIVEFTNYLSTMLNKGIGYTEHVAEKVNHVIDYSDYLAGMTEKNIHFSNYLGEKLNQNINYAEYVGGMTEKSIKFGNYLAEQLDKGIQYTEYVAEQASKGLNYSNYLAKSLNEAIKYAEYLGGNIQKGIAYTEYVAETMNQKVGPNAKLTTRRLLSDVAQLNESKTNVDETSAVTDLVSAVDGILASIKSNSANAVLENKYPFLKLLTTENKQKFYALEPDIKTAIVETLRGAVFFNEAEVINIMEAVMNKQAENTPTYIRFMPEKYKPLYEKMNDAELNWLAAQASTVVINTPYQAKAFWDSRDLRGINERIAQSANINNSAINENQGKEGYVSIDQVNQVQRGYSNAYIEALKRRAQS